MSLVPAWITAGAAIATLALVLFGKWLRHERRVGVLWGWRSAHRDYHKRHEPGFSEGEYSQNGDDDD